MGAGLLVQDVHPQLYFFVRYSGYYGGLGARGL